MSKIDEIRAEMVKAMKEKDKERKAYYNYYTSRHWGHSDNYDLCINTACYGIDGTVDILEKMVKLAYGHKEI